MTRVSLALLCFVGIGVVAAKDMEVIQRFGYDYVNHTVTTEDGYILTIHRVVPRDSSSQSSRPVIFLQHGLLFSSYAWVVDILEKPWAIRLADAGFDVWMGNNRGNKWSQNHVSLNLTSDEYWNFSWDEMAKYDLPAMIQYTLKVTNRPTLTYMAHSQGCTQAFAGFAINPDLASRVDTFIALAPVLSLYHADSERMHILSKKPSIKVFGKIGTNKFPPKGDEIRHYAPDWCTKFSEVCNLALGFFGGNTYGGDHFPSEFLFTKLISGFEDTSSKNVMHWIQQVRRPAFTAYDFENSTLNLQHYGTPSPPSYPISSLKVPTVLFFGDADGLTSVKDSEYVESQIPNIIGLRRDANATHMDFLWSKEMVDKIFPLVTNYARWHLKMLA